MLNRVIDWAIGNKLLVVITLFSLIVGSILALPKLNLDDLKFVISNAKLLIGNDNVDHKHLDSLRNFYLDHVQNLDLQVKLLIYLNHTVKNSNPCMPGNKKAKMSACSLKLSQCSRMPW